jgi:hypothetical protein
VIISQYNLDRILKWPTYSLLVFMCCYHYYGRIFDLLNRACLCGFIL